MTLQYTAQTNRPKCSKRVLEACRKQTGSRALALVHLPHVGLVRGAVRDVVSYDFRHGGERLVVLTVAILRAHAILFVDTAVAAAIVFPLAMLAVYTYSFAVCTSAVREGARWFSSKPWHYLVNSPPQVARGAAGILSLQHWHSAP